MRKKSSGWNVIKLTMAAEANIIADRFTTKELKHLIAELRRHVYARLQVRTRPLVEFEVARGRPVGLGVERRKETGRND